jgi:hypothetical protein
VQLTSIGVPWDVVKSMSYGDLNAYHIAARKLAVMHRINTYQGVMLTKCDPEKHQQIIDSWEAATNPKSPTPTRNANGNSNSPSRGYSLAEYAQILTGGGA